jgi:hypothetical protein
MAHWFDRLCDRAASGNGSMTRRDLVKAAGVGIGAAGALGSPFVGQAAGEGSRLLRAGACACNDDADRRFRRQADNLVAGNGISFYFNPISTAILGVAGTALISGYVARKVECGACRRNPSGANTPAPPSHAPCRARGGTCVETGDGGSGCPAGTTYCSGGLCCFGDDLCCGCNGQPTCCVSAVGCACC